METKENHLSRLETLPASAAAAPSPSSAGARTVEVAAPPARNRRRPFVIVLTVLGLLVAAIGGYLVLTAGEQDTDDAQVMADLVPVGTRAAGQIIRVAVKENELVKKGQLIAEIDPADYEARVMQAEAEVASSKAQAQAADAQVAVIEAGSKGGLTTARAALSGMTVGVGSAQAQVAAAKAALARAEADARKASIDLARAKELLAAKAIPAERLDSAQAQYDVAQAALAQAQANLAVATESRRVAEERVGEAKGRLSQSLPIDAQIAAAHAQADLAHARIKGAEAQLQLAKLQLGYTKVTAPADGVASKLTAHEGQLVAVGQPVIELVPTQTYVIANFKETQLENMKPGQRVDVKIDAYPGRRFSANVESLSGGTGASFSLLPADNASGNFVKVVQRVPVRIAWDKLPDMPLRAGLSADVTVHTKD